MFLQKISVKYIPGIMVHMRTGGYSNRSIYNRLKAHKEDYLAWKSIGITPRWFTLALKPLRKIEQFLVKKSPVESTNSIIYNTCKSEKGYRHRILERGLSFIKIFI